MGSSAGPICHYPLHCSPNILGVQGNAPLHFLVPAHPPDSSPRAPHAFGRTARRIRATPGEAGVGRPAGYAAAPPATPRRAPGHPSITAGLRPPGYQCAPTAGTKHASPRIPPMLAAVPDAARLAHAVRNYSTVIRGYADLLLGEIEDAGQREMIAEIRAAADQVARTSSRHLNRRARIAGRPSVEVGAYLRSLGPSVAALAGADIRTTLRCDLTDVFVSLDRSELDQVLLNVVENAADAMQGRGELTVTAGIAEAPHAGGVATFCRIAVCDTGPGIALDFAERVFDPFFTTKSEGTGIGLAEVRHVVGAAGGFVAVGSPPQGAEFWIYLPIARDPQSATFAVITDASAQAYGRPDAATPLS